MTVEPWLFATPPIRARDPQVALFAFGTGPLGREIDLSTEADRFGAPSSESLRTCTVQTIARRQDPAWFDGFRSGSLRAIATQDLGAGCAALDAADHVHVIASQPRAVKDLTYLQAAWAHARCVVQRGASVDVRRDGDGVRARRSPSRARTSRSISAVRSARRTRPARAARTSRTRCTPAGYASSDARDLIALCTDADVPLVGQAIGELAVRSRAAPTSRRRPTRSISADAVGRRRGRARLRELLQLNNAARVLVDDAGRDLMGVALRTPAS